MQTPLSKFKQRLQDLLQENYPVKTKQNKLIYETYSQIIFFLGKEIDNEKEFLLQFGNRMQTIRDVSFDGDVEFAYNPAEELGLLPKTDEIILENGEII